MLPLEHSAILLTCIKWLLKTGFTVHSFYLCFLSLINEDRLNCNNSLVCGVDLRLALLQKQQKDIFVGIFGIDLVVFISYSHLYLPFCHQSLSQCCSC